MDCGVTLNSRESSAGVRPARINSTSCCLNCAGYGGLTLDICGSLNTKNDVSTEPGQLQLPEPQLHVLSLQRRYAEVTTHLAWLSQQESALSRAYSIHG